MGCCVSTDNKPSSTSQKQQQQHFHVGSAEPSRPNSTHESRAPPPDPEETVKEVLSETPKLKPPPSLSPPQLTVKKTHLQHDQKIHVQPQFLDENIPKQNRDKNEEEAMLSDQQDLSEVCSLSLSESVSTTTVTNDRRDYCDDDDDDEGEVKQRVMMRSPSPKLVQRNRGIPSDWGPKRDRVVGKSPTQRSEQSPKKKNNSAGGGGGRVRMAQSREPGVGKRPGLSSDPNKRDPGESSRRRSRSPASNRSAMGRSPSTRGPNRSPGRVGKEPPENNGGGGSNIKMDGGGEPKWASTTNNGTTTSESLENPLVSLECFIFL